MHQEKAGKMVKIDIIRLIVMELYLFICCFECHILKKLGLGKGEFKCLNWFD